MSATTAPSGNLPPSPLGSFQPCGGTPAFDPLDLLELAARAHEPCFVVQDREDGRIGVATGDGGRANWGEDGPYRLLACLSPASPEWLGDRSFMEAHGVRFPYVAGEMAQG